MIGYYFLAEWEKEWHALSSKDILKKGDGVRYCLAFHEEPPTPIQNHFIGREAWYPHNSFTYYRRNQPKP